MIVVAVSVYISFVAVCWTVGVVHWSRVGWCRGVASVRIGVFFGVFGYVSWGRIIFYRYVSIFSRSVFV